MWQLFIKILGKPYAHKNSTNCTWSNARIIMHWNKALDNQEANMILHFFPSVSLISDFPENIAWYLLYLLFYKIWRNELLLILGVHLCVLKCRYWGCFFVSGKRNPRRQGQPSGCPIFYWEGEKFGQTHPTIQQWIHREFYGCWKKRWHLNIYPTDGFFYVCMYSVLTNQLIYFWFRQVSEVPSFSSWRTSRVWTMMVFLTKMSFPHRRTSYWQNWALYN